MIDVGSSSVRAAVLTDDGSLRHLSQRPIHVASPAPGLVEVDGSEIGQVVIELAVKTLEEAGPVQGVGIANQRATTLVWERGSGELVGPGIGWQDLRTVGTCLGMQADGFRFPPNASATKLSWLLDQFDPERVRAGELCFGTIDTWCAWVLSEGTVHATDATNASVTALMTDDGRGWDGRVLEALHIPPELLPDIVDSSGVIGEARGLPGAPPICGIAGDQQASLFGQGCTRPGLAKATFGTGGMLDQCVGEMATGPIAQLAPGGTFPLVAWRRRGRNVYAIEALMLSAGSCVDWLRDDIGIITDSSSSQQIASRCQDTGGAWFVPALVGLGTPLWDFGARGTLLGVTLGTGRAELVRAVLEGVAHRGADLLEAAETDSGQRVSTLRVDGGMSANEVFVQALANATGRPIELSENIEATTMGAGLLAGLGAALWRDEDETSAAYRPRRTVEPANTDSERVAARERWFAVRERALETIPELSAIKF
ncbi:MAG: FGGY family carbohydrate kinase [Acidimicrobiales bacterium]